MNKKVKKLWVKALASGEYSQGYGALRNYSNKFCCLGVLCDLFLKYKNSEPNWLDEEGLGFSFLGQVAVLPHEVADWAELELLVPEVDPEKVVELARGKKISINEKHSQYICRQYGSDLVAFNDYGLEFSDIAEIINGCL